jgi:hypothetical protein
LFVAHHRDFFIVYINATKVGNVEQHANAFVDPNRPDLVQNVTMSLTCHILLNHIRLLSMTDWLAFVYVHC